MSERSDPALLAPYPCVEAGRHVEGTDHPAWDCSQDCPRHDRGERSYCTCLDAHAKASDRAGDERA